MSRFSRDILPNPVLFNSYSFLFLFLPVCVIGYYAIGRRYQLEAALHWLTLCSFFFYGWWNPAYLALIIFSMGFNFALGRVLLPEARPPLFPRKAWLVFGIATNLLLIAWFKYAGFLTLTLNSLAGTDYNLGHIILPLGISFFTFTQIAFLVDVYRGIARENNLVHYFLFVTYFPHLVAGTIVHYKEIIPEFLKQKEFRLRHEDLALGLTVFIVGLFKKVVLADGISPFVAPVFDAASHGVALTFFEGWGAALAYTLQLYFDFSGYSDMAIGLALLFGVCLPINFFSPYRSRNIIEFWRRWHISLSRFLRDYLYIALGGNRFGTLMRYRNLMITMLLGGLWHGAAWSFVFWGGLHGVYLVICHAWTALVDNYKNLPRLKLLMAPIAWTLTFLAVVIAWVFFRASSFGAALDILAAMFGLHGIVLHPETSPTLLHWLQLTHIAFERSVYATRYLNADVILWILWLLAFALLLPNIYQMTAQERPARDQSKLIDENPDAHLVYALYWRWVCVMVVMATVALVNMNKVSEFLYFQF